jgi:hypothetical protein
VTAQSKIEPAPPQSVYAKIAAVQGALASTGIGKDRTNSTPGANYRFRGIDDVYNALAPLLATHGLCILPRVVAHTLTERGKTKNGNAIFSAVVDAEFDFVSADDGSCHVIRTVGEAMDSSDKATNKAMSAAYKYAAFMAFAIPTEGDNDADANTHEVAVAPDAMPDSEWAKLVQLVEATSANVPAMLKYLNVRVPGDNLRLLNPDQYTKVLDALNDKLAKMAKAETDAKAKEPA